MPEKQSIEEIYAEIDHWHVNTGGETIHAKRIPGFFRNLKWWSASVWLIFFLGPYLRWDDRQAILFDIPNRQFHIFGITILPQDVWMLALVLLFFAIMLAVVTSIAGRVYCGYFCFQTVWTDIFTWIEEKLEGPPAQQRKFAHSPLTLSKFRTLAIKHGLWIAIGALTGISFTLWFDDAFELWYAFFTFNAGIVAYSSVAVFTVFTYLFAGLMREQVCFWLCPYARIQGVMVDSESIMPTYDIKRGEPRGKLKKGATEEGKGDCISCHQCVAVCPTGVDIRDGQQEGCITCGLCIDACDVVMDKIHKPKGLIRYSSLNELNGKPEVALYKRPRVLIYSTIMSLAFIGIVYGLLNMGELELKVLHERQPLFVRLSSGDIQNKYNLKILNKTDKPLQIQVQVEGPSNLRLIGAEKPFYAQPGTTSSHTVYIRIALNRLNRDRHPIFFTIQSIENNKIRSEYESMFFSTK